MTDQVTAQVTVEELAALMRRTAGVTVDPRELAERAESGFDAFGLDSLGLLGIVGELEKSHGLDLPDHAERCRTPREFLRCVNGALTTEV
ncbi:acyl carrier protein [Streptomyces sp. TRM43335]|uniref:Acyl carrier protein n=1 Tax=Streptomyces taklimakanensis TaxID=2569853 RepID=A0A6G2BJ68_9ACTN|nr:acyl carrier protein [Streptomyces taklimakanensis]MTE22290.1 acyl carrier protein [Streptomyces taklimakanensis]